MIEIFVNLIEIYHRPHPSRSLNLLLDFNLQIQKDLSLNLAFRITLINFLWILIPLSFIFINNLYLNIEKYCC
jgi:hypothetical protein